MFLRMRVTDGGSTSSVVLVVATIIQKLCCDGVAIAMNQEEEL